MSENKLFRNTLFELVGEINHGETPMVTNKLSETSKYSRTRLNIGIKNGSNSQFLNMEYIHEVNNFKTVKLVDKEDYKLFDVNVADTIKPEILEKVADFTKIIIDLEQDQDIKSERAKLFFKRKNHLDKEEQTEEDKAKIEEYTKQIEELSSNRFEFAHMKDVIPFLNAKLPELKGKKVRAKGRAEVNYYNGKTNLQFKPSLIEIVPEETNNMLTMYTDVFFDKDGVTDIKDEKKIIVNGYIGAMKSKKETLYPIDLVVDYSKVNQEDETQLIFLELARDIFKIRDKKSVHKNAVAIGIINGREEKEFDESCLTELQRKQVLAGLRKVEDFKPRNGVQGDKIQELRVFMADAEVMPEGAIDVFPIRELAEYLPNDDGDKTEKEVKKQPKKEESETPKEDKPQDAMAMMAGLFS